MKIFIAALATESNTFSPIPTGLAGFTAQGYYRRDGSLGPPTHGNLALIEWRRLAEADGHTIIDSLCAFAQPAGTTLRAVYEDFREMILADLRAAAPVDLVLLKMHGAMVAYGYDDCEGDLLTQVRAIVGPDIIIGIELDLHCHLTETMRRSASVIVTYKEYPHTDIVPRATELYTICLAAALGKTRPVIAYHDCRSVSMWRTPVDPVKSFVARMQALEGKNGILSVSFGHGFPWGDVADVGAKIVVVADGDQAAAQKLADQLGAEIWAMRNEAAPVHDTVEEALNRIAATGKPLVLAEVADNAGGGAPSDNTETLRSMVARNIQRAAIGCFWDPVAVSFCQEAGLGAEFELRIGGKSGVASGLPVDLRIVVMGLSDAHSQGGLGGGRAAFGPSAWVRAGGIDIILVTKRGQVFHQDAFTALGCTLEDKAVIVVKSTQHFYAGFAPISSAIHYVATSGAIAPDFAAIPFTKRTTPFWPRVANPWETNE